MSQIKIYALDETIELHRDNLSKAIHQALVKELKYPEEKRFQRFIPLESKNFIYPADRSASYIIIEISMFDGRTKETKKAFNSKSNCCAVQCFDYNSLSLSIALFFICFEISKCRYPTIRYART